MNYFAFAGTVLNTNISIPESLFSLIEQHYEISRDMLKSKSRKREVTDLRHIFLVLVKEFTPYGLAKIGAIVNRDHATVVHSQKKVDRLLETDKEFRQQYEKLRIGLEHHIVRSKNLKEDVRRIETVKTYSLKLRKLKKLQKDLEI